MPTFENYKPDREYVKALHVSRSGSGKSKAASTYPLPFHQWDYDGRHDSLEQEVQPIGQLDPKLVSYTRFYAKNGFEPLQSEMTKLENLRLNGQFPYKTIELASITTFVDALTASSHKLQAGRKIGSLRMNGPGDFNFEVTGMKQLMEQLDIYPCNIIVSAHVLDKWGKPKTGKPGEEYAQNEIIGEKINLRDQPGESLLSLFSNVFSFSREVVGNVMHYYVNFATDMAKNTFGIPPGEHDITGKAFYPYLQNLIQEIRTGTYKPPAANSGMSFL